MCIYMYICITGSLCCTEVIDRTLSVNYNKKILNLKYKDGPEIIKMLSSNEHHFIILNHLYNFAITDNKDPGDYEIMVKNCFDCLFN